MNISCASKVLQLCKQDKAHLSETSYFSGKVLSASFLLTLYWTVLKYALLLLVFLMSPMSKYQLNYFNNKKTHTAYIYVNTSSIILTAVSFYILFIYFYLILLSLHFLLHTFLFISLFIFSLLSLSLLSVRKLLY